jgi:hypothetical protein
MSISTMKRNVNFAAGLDTVRDAHLVLLKSIGMEAARTSVGGVEILRWVWAVSIPQADSMRSDV